MSYILYPCKNSTSIHLFLVLLYDNYVEYWERYESLKIRDEFIKSCTLSRLPGCPIESSDRDKRDQSPAEVIIPEVCCLWGGASSIPVCITYTRVCTRMFDNIDPESMAEEQKHRERERPATWSASLEVDSRLFLWKPCGSKRSGGQGLLYRHWAPERYRSKTRALPQTHTNESLNTFLDRS